MFVLNTLQELVAMTEMVILISTDHSPVLFQKRKSAIRYKEFWKFNTSLTKYQN